MPWQTKNLPIKRKLNRLKRTHAQAVLHAPFEETKKYICMNAEANLIC